MVVRILKNIWTAYWYFLFSGIFFLFYPLFRFTLSHPSRYQMANTLRRTWAKILFLLTGLWYRVDYDPAFREAYLQKNRSQGLIYCPNHTSYLDIPSFAIAIPGHWRFMAKAELARIPVFGIFFRTIDIPVARSSKIASYRAFKSAKASLRNKVSLVIFPEGTTATHPPQLLPFKSGPFRLAIEEQVPVVPITFLDNWRRFPNNGKQQGMPGITRIYIHAPIETIGLTTKDVERLKQKVYDCITDKLNRTDEIRPTNRTEDRHVGQAQV